jgi:hypothetical protein
MRKMKIIIALTLCITMIFCVTSSSLAATGWDTCTSCHKEGDKPAPSKATLLKKFKTADDFIKAAKEEKNPMMNSVKDDDRLKAAAKDLGLK